MQKYFTGFGKRPSLMRLVVGYGQDQPPEMDVVVVTGELTWVVRLWLSIVSPILISMASFPIRNRLTINVETVPVGTQIALSWSRTSKTRGEGGRSD